MRGRLTNQNQGNAPKVLTSSNSLAALEHHHHLCPGSSHETRAPPILPDSGIKEFIPTVLQSDSKNFMDPSLSQKGHGIPNRRVGTNSGANHGTFSSLVSRYQAPPRRVENGGETAEKVRL